MKTETRMKLTIPVILLSIPFAMLGIVMTSFVWVASKAGTDAIFYTGYCGVVMAIFGACNLGYHKGRIDERHTTQAGEACSDAVKPPNDERSS